MFFEYAQQQGHGRLTCAVPHVADPGIVLAGQVPRLLGGVTTNLSSLPAHRPPGSRGQCQPGASDSWKMESRMHSMHQERLTGTSVVPEHLSM